MRELRHGIAPWEPVPGIELPTRVAGIMRVLLGGLHVTARPDEAARHADAVVIGEGESVWPQLLADLEAGRLQPRYDARPHNFDFRHAPMPRYDLLDVSRYNHLTVQTQRGCPFNCDFCGAYIRLNPRFKTKPVERVVAEIRRIKEAWAHPFIEFADDNTFADKKHGRELVRALIPEGVRWFTETGISVARDPELLAVMKDAGCAQILVGLESPAPAALDGIERKANWKRQQLDDRTAFDAIFNFVRETGLYEVQITVMTAFPGAPLYERLLAEGRVLTPDAWELCTLFDINYEPRGMTVAELADGFRDLARRIYDDAFIEERRRRFFQRQSVLRRERSASIL